MPRLGPRHELLTVVFLRGVSCHANAGHDLGLAQARRSWQCSSTAAVDDGRVAGAAVDRVACGDAAGTGGGLMCGRRVR